MSVHVCVWMEMGKNVFESVCVRKRWGERRRSTWNHPSLESGRS